jgi:hypothetical protein
VNAEHAENQHTEQEHSTMNEQARSDEKVQKPSTYFDEPQEVVVDSSLSKPQKVEALETLEQDARQLAEASSEGMGGGESNNLHDVLIAKDTLALQSVSDDDAYETVLQDLRSRQKCDPALNTRILLAQAIAALEGLALSAMQPSAVAADATSTIAGAVR